MAVVSSTGRKSAIGILIFSALLTSCNTIPDKPPEYPQDLLQEDSSFQVVRIDSSEETVRTWYSLAYFSKSYITPVFDTLDWTIQEFGGGYSENDLAGGFISLQSKAYTSGDADLLSKDIIVLDESGSVICRRQIQYRTPDDRKIGSRTVTYISENLVIPQETGLPFHIQLAERDNSIIYAEWDIRESP